jgi:hypothetical protein
MDEQDILLPGQLAHARGEAAAAEEGIGHPAGRTPPIDELRFSLEGQVDVLADFETKRATRS